MSTAQSILFKADKWTPAEARKWLKGQGYKPIKKAHITDYYIHYRIKEPDNTKKYRTIIFGKYIKAVIQV